MKTPATDDNTQTIKFGKDIDGEIYINGMYMGKLKSCKLKTAVDSKNNKKLFYSFELTSGEQFFRDKKNGPKKKFYRESKGDYANNSRTNRTKTR